jgi:hypothetical protein
MDLDALAYQREEMGEGLVEGHRARMLDEICTMG